MKKLLIILLGLMLLCGCAFAEEEAAEEVDAVSSVTLKQITKLHEVETQDNGVIVNTVTDILFAVVDPRVRL